MNLSPDQLDALIAYATVGASLVALLSVIGGAIAYVVTNKAMQRGMLKRVDALEQQIKETVTESRCLHCREECNKNMKERLHNNYELLVTMITNLSEKIDAIYTDVKSIRNGNK